MPTAMLRKSLDTALAWQKSFQLDVKLYKDVDHTPVVEFGSI